MNQQTNKQTESHAKLANLSLWVNDIRKSRHFFSEVVGLAELGAELDEYPYVTYGEPGVLIFAIVQAEEALPPKTDWAKWPAMSDLNDSWDPYRTILVPDLDVVIARCQAANVPMRQEKPVEVADGKMVFIEVKDPDGNTWALRQA